MQDFSKCSDSDLKKIIEKYSEKRCGHCAFWMLKDLCKREEDHIVSMNEFACNKFQIKQWYLDIIRECEHELVMRHI